MYLLGVDGGGSKTRALLATVDGAVVGVGMAPSSNIHTAGFDGAMDALLEAINAAWVQVRFSPQLHSHRGCPLGVRGVAAGGDEGLPILAACFGMAGAGRPEDQQRIHAWAVERAIASQVLVTTDAEPLLAAGTPDGWGIALIAGTGSICFGRTADNRWMRAGGWGPLLGDEGSGYDIARAALRLATQTADGRGDAPRILAVTLAHWGLDHPDQLVTRIYDPQTERADIAALAPRIFDLAEQGDNAARAILDDAAKELARLVRAVVRKLKLDAPPLALGGGLLAVDGAMSRRVERACKDMVGPITHVSDPATGALVIARRLYEQRVALTPDP